MGTVLAWEVSGWFPHCPVALEEERMAKLVALNFSHPQGEEITNQ